VPPRPDDETIEGTIAAPINGPPGTIVGVGVSTPSRTASRDEELPGKVAGRYTIVRWLGGGGMGRVYEAVDDELGERVALKMLRGGLTEEALERFRREVRLTRRIQHRNVARMYDIGDHEGEKFLTMELVDGEPLTRRVGRPMPWPELRELALQLCAGLEAAHATGVVHRDLKPDNVLVEKATNRAVITDFGIARGNDDASVTQAGMVVGTPRYMAPEQLAGGELDGRADLFALGVMLYELASGTRPWSGDSAVAIAVAQATRAARPLRAALPLHAVSVIEKCIAIDRDARPATVSAVAEALHAADAPVFGTIDAPAGIEPDARANTELASAVRPAPLPHSSNVASLITPTSIAPTTLAVVPFRAEAADAPLALTVREDLIDLLSTTPSILVRPAGINVEGATDPREIGRTLGVDVVVVGALRRMPSGLRISARLIGVADGFQIGAHHADGADVDVLALTDRLGRQVADTLSTRAATPADRPTDPRAVELYLRARAELRLFWAEHAVRAVELLDQAVALAPSSPQVLGLHACAMVHLWARNNKPATLELARQSVERALAAGHAEGILASGLLRVNQGDVEGGLGLVGQALRRAPMLGAAHEQAGRYLVEAGDVDAGRHHFAIALALDPGRKQNADVDLGRTEALYGDWEAADRRFAELAASLEPPFRVLGLMAQARLATWRRDREALQGFGRQLHKQVSLDPTGLSAVMFKFLETNEFDVDELQASVVRMHDLSRPRRPMLVGLQRAIEVCGLVGRDDLGLMALGCADDLGVIDVVWLDRCPVLDGLRGMNGFEQVRARISARAARALTAFHAATGAR
jgi:serine/threonine-protein kinase